LCWQVANWGAWVSLYACASLGASHGLMDLGGHTLMLPPVMLWKDIFNCMAGRLPSFLTLLHASWMIHSIEVSFYEVASDRWMDDVCRVCPLCRGNVCEPKAVDTGVETALETWSTLITVWILLILYKKHYTCFSPLQFLVFVFCTFSLSSMACWSC
jgi:hypothetical protein